jgi:phosphodiesterase/alkaline phosphatase D-like protein
MKSNEARVVFTVSTGQMFSDQDRPDGFEIYPSMLKMNPDFFVHTGDILY